jgi:hypothetical protein
MDLKFNGAALQDRFAAFVLKYKRDGFYLDIGSCHALSCNNTYAFEELGWKGICIERDSQHNESYKQRNCIYVNADATELDYNELLKDVAVDYLSLDVDAASTSVLKKLPVEKINVITIEHDYYTLGDDYRNEQRAILSKTHFLLCADVLVPLQHDTKPDWAFEDWWVRKDMMTLELEKLKCEHKYPQQIIDSLR